MPRSYKTRSGARNARTGLKRSAHRLDPDFDQIGSAGRTGRSGRHESTNSTAIRGKRTPEDDAKVLDILDSRSTGNVRKKSPAKKARKAAARDKSRPRAAKPSTTRSSDSSAAPDRRRRASASPSRPPAKPRRATSTGGKRSTARR